VSATPALRRFSKRIIEVPLTDQQQPAKMLAYMTLINAADRNQEALELLGEAKAFGEANNISIANLLLTEVSLRLTAGDGAGFQKAIETLSTRYGGEPEVMARLQQMLMAYGLISPDGSPRQTPPAAAGTPSAAPAAGGPGEIWTPDSAAPASKGGESKIWIPGMD
jgi:hypothetical protein